MGKSRLVGSLDFHRDIDEFGRMPVIGSQNSQADRFRYFGPVLPNPTLAYDRIAIPGINQILIDKIGLAKTDIQVFTSKISPLSSPSARC